MRWRTRLLLLMGAAGLLMYLGFAAQNFYGGSRTIQLLVYAHLPVPAGTPPLSRFIESPAGLYSTGSTGELLYHASSLLDYLLFYSIDNFGFLDVLFIFFASLYLHGAVSRLQPDHALLAGTSQAFYRLGLGSTCMFFAKMPFNLYVAAAFAERTQHQFVLANRSSVMLYALLGSLLMLCTPSYSTRQPQLQQDAELTN